jgi:tetrahydromethanopterin S-methyltransferase subunit A
LPVPAFNAFNEAMDRLDRTGTPLTAPFKCELIRPVDFVPQNWPPQPGNYRVFNATKSIALVLFDDGDMDMIQREALFSKIAVAGTISTENLGVEHLVKNIISNPYIRHAVLWGRDIEGHLPGDALLSLSFNGCDHSGRISGARGARPVLKNLTSLEIRHFRSQVRMIDVTGTRETSELAGQLALLDGNSVQAYESGLKVDLVETLRAEPATRLNLDPAGYFVIMVMKGAAYPLLLEHYSNNGRLRNIIEGKDAATLCSTVIEKELISQLDHAAYLGRELAKAEFSLRSDSTYIQDRAQGDVL